MPIHNSSFFNLVPNETTFFKSQTQNLASLVNLKVKTLLLFLRKSFSILQMLLEFHLQDCLHPPCVVPEPQLKVRLGQVQRVVVTTLTNQDERRIETKQYFSTERDFSVVTSRIQTLKTIF